MEILSFTDYLRPLGRLVLRKPIDTAVVSGGSDGSIYFIDEGGSRVQRHWIMLPSFPELCFGNGTNTIEYL